MMCGERCRLYKAAVSGIFISTAMAIVSEVFPGWGKVTANQTTYLTGLWMDCQNQTLSLCRVREFNNFRVFEQVSQAFHVTGVICLFLSCYFVINYNCLEVISRHWRGVEISAVVGGVLCFVGTFVYIVATSVSRQYNYGPVLFLSVISSALAINFGFIIAVANKPREHGSL